MREKRILLVDDEAFILDTYSSLLEEKGYTVATACSGRKAFEVFSCCSFDLLITDLAMDDGDGFTLIDEIQDIAPYTPIIVFTGRKYTNSKKFITLLGANELIQKPCSNELFISCVSNSLQAKT